MNWSRFKTTLLEQGRLSEVFSEKASILPDERQFTGTQDKISISYNPLRVAFHANAISKQLENLLGLRREFRELEILAIKSIVDYDLFKTTSVIDAEIETRRLAIDEKSKEKTTHQTAAASFGDGSEILAGFSKLSLGRIDELIVAIENARRIGEKINERLLALSEYQRLYFTRHTEPGNAHNYAERANRISLLINDDILDLTFRVLALQRGMSTIYAYESKPPEITSNLNSLDDLVLWIREINRELERRSQSEQVFDLVVPLVQPWLLDGSSLVVRADFDRILSKDTDDLISLNFDIDERAFFGRPVRLKGFGISFGNVFGMIKESGIDSVQTADSFVRMSALVIPPKQQGATNTTQLLLGNIALHQGDQPVAFVDGAPIENISPFGRWEIRLHPRIVWKDSGSHQLNKGVEGKVIRDLKLTFRAYLPGGDSI